MMRLHRFIGDFDFSKQEFFIKDIGIENKIRKVLRLKTGNRLMFVDKNHIEAEAEIKSVRKKGILVNVIKINKSKRDYTLRVTLYCSILKRENFELVVQKATEVGVVCIVPLIAARTIKLGLNKKRMEKIAREAAEQSGRVAAPVIEEPILFDAAIHHSRQNDRNIIFDMERGIVRKEKTKTSRAAGIFIGPEGGWEAREIECARKRGFNVARLGEFTLRAETAAIVASYLVTNSFI